MATGRSLSSVVHCRIAGKKIENNATSEEMTTEIIFPGSSIVEHLLINSPVHSPCHLEGKAAHEKRIQNVSKT